MNKHDLKILPEHFSAVISGKKKAEFRINDRGYSVGDLLHLHEYGWVKDCDGLEGFSGESILVRVSHITDLAIWKPGYVLLSIEIESSSQVGTQPAVREGFKLVPIEPTPEMIAAAMDCDDVLFDKREEDVFYVQHRNIYAAMLAAVPGNPE